MKVEIGLMLGIKSMWKSIWDLEKSITFFFIFTLFLGINPLKSNKKALNPAVNIICMVLIMNRGITVIDVTLFIIQIVTKHCHPILNIKKKVCNTVWYNEAVNLVLKYTLRCWLRLRERKQKYTGNIFWKLDIISSLLKWYR